MALLDRTTKKLRLTSDQDRRLECAAKFRGQSQQGFLLAACLRAIEDTESDEKAARHQGQPRRDTSTRRVSAPTGLGLRLRSEPVPTAGSPPAPSPVVVNVGGATSDSEEFVSRLATYVAAGPGYDREARLRKVVEIIELSSASAQEGVALAERLDAAVAQIDKGRTGHRAGWRSAGAGVFESIKDYLKP